jgi:hypothetical protein
MRAEQTVNDLAEETLARQAMALLQRSGEPLSDVLKDILEYPAGLQPEELRGREHQDEEDPLFPSFNYCLDESDPDILMLRRQDGSYVAAFSARGATREGIIEAAKDDYRELVRIYWASQKAAA